MVPTAEATTSARGSLTIGSHHLSIDDRGHLRTKRSSLPSSHGVRTRPSKNAAAAATPMTYDVLYDPQYDQWRGRSHGCGRPAHGVTDARAVDGQPRPDQVAGGSAGSGIKATQAEEPDTRQPTTPQTASLASPEFASFARLANALLPQMLEEEAGRQPARKAEPRLGSPSSPAQMMNILEAEGRREAAARLASPHHEAGGHPSG